MSVPVAFATAVVCVALDERDRTILDAVASLSGALGLRRVVVAHVAHVESIATALLGGIAPDRGSLEPPPGLEHLAADLGRAIPEVEVVTAHRVGTVHEELIALACDVEADLVVLGRTAPDGGRTMWGSRGEAVARHADRSVLVVPDGHVPRGGRVVVGLDFSQGSHRALEAAVTLGRRVQAVYGYRVDAAISYGGLAPTDFQHHVEQHARRHFADEVLPTLPQGALEPQLVCVSGSRVSDTLVAKASGADLLVVGGAGRTRLARMLLGSTAERVAGRSDTSVLIVRQKGKLQGLAQTLLA